MKVHRAFAEDFNRYAQLLGPASRAYLFFEQGLWAIAIYRFGQWAGGLRFPVLGGLLRAVSFLAFKVSEVVTGVSLPPTAKIGGGFYVGHFGGIVVHPEAILGARCAVGPGVVIGTRGLGSPGTPVLGDDVYVGVGAKILGPIKVGNGVRVGANAVVICDLPDGATAIGIPARVVRCGERVGQAPSHSAHES